jgi:sulfatase modifying factor 1
LWTPSDAGYDSTNLFRNKLAKYFLPSLNEWYKSAYYDPAAGAYYDYPTGSDSIPDGIDFVGDPNFDAVFYDGAFNPNPNNITNVGLLSPFGTAGQGGNVREWVETAFDRTNNSANEQRSTPGGSWADGYTLLDATNTGIGISPPNDNIVVGFRISSTVPEPSSIILLTIGCALGLSTRRHRNSARVSRATTI